MISSLDRKLLRDLWRIKGQALAIALVIGSGVCMFVMYRSTFDSLSFTLRTYYDDQRFGDVFAAAKRAPQSLAERISALPGVARAETRVVAGVTLDMPDMDEPAMGRLVSVPSHGRPLLNDVYLRQGRWLAPDRPDEVVVSDSFAVRNHLEPGDTLNAVLNGTRRKLRIVGIGLSPEYIYSIRQGDLMPDPKRFGILWMDRKALAAAFDLEGSFNDVSLKLVPGAQEEDVMAGLDHLLEPYGGLGAVPRSLQISHWYLSNELRQLQNMGSSLPLLFLLVAAFLLNVVLARIVTVQREQIAALKANGYANRTLGFHYAKLGFLVTAAGIVLGAIGGYFLGLDVTRMYTEIFNFPVLRYSVPPARILQAAGVALGAALIGVLGAVRRVAALPPAEALRPEAPAGYKETFLERIGLGRFLSPPSRMILRNLSRRPMRTVIAVGGIAAGCALVIMGNSIRDAVVGLMEEQFNIVEHQDVTVTFTEPASPRALHELARLPGVTYAEPSRAVSARIFHGQLSRRIALQGLLPGARLNRVVDAETGPVLLPESGLVLSSSLADLLDAKAGDELIVQVLEGSRPERRMRVVQVVDQHLGTWAYLRIGTVQDMMGDAGISGAYLQVEPSQADELYDRLKETPRVSAVSRKQAAVDSFRQIFAKNLNVLVFFFSLFATIIAFGVVYNSARISLSERSRELASLRVLGFRRSEISFIFLGELAIVTVIALPVGFALGWGLAVLVLQSFGTELYRFPLVLTRQAFASAGMTVVLSALVSGLAVRRQLDRLDLIAVLKTPE
ncbi:MAG TPA: ABC transporter permease [Thermoanaerobaculia bacterium]|jgi:putative ABC transport system permease protein|nr:ABC transporter permease [Thermoanaerobaculia bacterium]